MIQPVDIINITVDPASGSPAVVIRESSGQRYFAVPVGHSEAGCIALSTMDAGPDLPFAVDLAKIIADELGGTIEKIVFTQGEKALQARIYLRSPSFRHIIDCRAPDALSLAARHHIPLYADDVLFCIDNDNRLSDDEKLQLSICSIDAVDFGAYHLE